MSKSIIIVVLLGFLVGCNKEPIPMNKILDDTLLKNVVLVPLEQTNSKNNSSIFVDKKLIYKENVDTILLKKILGFDFGERIIEFNQRGVYRIYPFLDIDTSKINNTISLHLMINNNKTFSIENIDTVLNLYNIYGLYLLFNRTSSLDLKKKIAEFVWFNSSKEEKRIYSNECLMFYQYIAENSNRRDVEFNHTEYTFKQLPIDTIIDIVYTFKNNGKEKTLIEYVTASCNCTQITYPKYPIEANHCDSIRIRYKPKTKGYNSTSITAKFLYNKYPFKLGIKCLAK